MANIHREGNRLRFFTISVTKSFYILSLICLIFLDLSSVAQEALTEHYVSEDGVLSFRYPSSWIVSADNESSVAIQNDENFMAIYKPIPEARDTLEALEFFVLGSSAFSNSETFDVNGQPAAKFVTDQRDVLAIGYEFSGTLPGALLIVSPIGESDSLVPLALEIAESIQLSSDFSSQAAIDQDSDAKRWFLLGHPGGRSAISSSESYGISPVNPDFRFAILGPDGLLISTDGGVSWKNVFEDLSARVSDSPVILQAQFDLVDERTIHILANGQLFTSHDEGSTWERKYQPAYSLGVGGTGEILYVLRNNAVVVSEDGGETWVTTAPEVPNHIRPDGSTNCHRRTK